MTKSDRLVPEFDSPLRKSTILIGGFNLGASIMGGGILSIPFALSKTGVALGFLLMLVAAIATERSMYLLCLCARITGGKTFGEVGEAAFGKSMDYFISCVLCVYLCFAMIGYMVLAKDIWTSVIRVIGNMETPPNDEWVLGIIIILLVPLLVQESLHALRFSCYVGVFSVLTLCLALVRHAIAVPVWENVLLWSTNLNDVLVAFPIISFSFAAIFNVLPIQNDLVQPTRPRIQRVLGGSIGIVFVIELVFGLAGYLYAGVNTEGNILRNCEATNDVNELLGKVGCGTMVLMAIPLMMLPCRSCFLEILDVLVNGAHATPVEVRELEKLPLITTDTMRSDNSYNTISTATSEEDPYPPQHVEGEAQRESNSNQQLHKVNIVDNTMMHYGSTVLLFASCYMVAVRVPGVAVVWSILGCLGGNLVSFILPAALYLKIQKKYPGQQASAWVCFSWSLLVVSIVATVVCTTQAVKAIL